MARNNRKPRPASSFDVSKAYNTARAYNKQLKDNVVPDRKTGESRPMSDKQKAYRQGYTKGVSTLGNGIMAQASNGKITDGKLPEGKGVAHNLFDLPNAAK